jgi:glycosyltransferase involved in cell wall biosynthesis
MNILLLIPELGKGGAQRSITKLCNTLSSEHKVLLYTFHPEYEQKFETTVAPKHLAPLASGKWEKIKIWKQRQRELKRIKDEEKIDVAISFLEGANYINAMTKGKEKVILSVRGSKQFDNKIAGLSGWFRKKVLIPRYFKKADQVVAVSDGIKEELVHFFGLEENKITVIKNYYKVDEIGKMAQESCDFNFDKKTIAFSGRLDIQKELKGLIKSFALLRKKMDVQLILLGDGRMRKDLELLTKELHLKINEDVHFLGFQSNPFKFIAKSDLFALSSSWEGFPNALAEAILCKTAVISTDCPTGPREILEANITGFQTAKKAIYTNKGCLMPLLNQSKEEVYELWASEMERMLSRDNRLEINEAYNYISKYTEENIFSKWKKVVEA